MICKQDVLLWFEKLESYNRIETMYALLTACLPFELRFLGTLLEEQGRCDSETLRGMELRANNPQELAADMFTCQKGDPTDRKIRRKMALYLALIRACNRNCVSEIYRTLECWGECDFGCINDQDTLLELLLVYTMAAIHPVFSMDEQKKIFGILGKIKENKLVADNFPVQAQMEQTQSHPHPPHPHAPSQHDLIMQQQQQQQQQHVMHQIQAQQQAHQHQQQQHPPMVQVVQTPQGNIPMIFPQHFQKLVPGTDGTHQISVDGVPHMMQSNITIPADTNAILGHQNTAAAWSMRHYAPPPHPQTAAPQQQQNIDHHVPPASSSPMLSQQSSPSSSRTTSPQRSNVPQQSQQMRNLSQRLTGHKHHAARRPSAETTPPPSSISGELQHENINEGGSSSSSGTSLPSLIRNGFQRPTHHHRVKANAYIPPHQQQQQQQHFQNNAYMNSMMQNMSMNDDGSGSVTKSVATTGSESGSSNGSCGDISPPETPTPHPLPLHSTVGNPGMGMITTVVHSGMGGGYQQKHHLTYKQQQQQMNLQQRLNGRNGMEKSYQQIYTTGTPSNVSDAQTMTMSSGNMQQQQALLISPSPVSTPTTTVLLQQQSQQQPQPQPPPPTAYNAASYPYHTRGPPPQQTIFQAHNAPPPPQSVRGGYRFPMAPVSHNGELIYPAFHTSLAFLPVPGTGGTPTAVTPPQLQNSAAVVSTNAVAVQTPTPQQQQLPTTPPYSALTVCPITGVGGGGAPKISCYNCGSQTHIGRDCQEASMEDVTRSASYKLDYSETQSIEANSIGDHSNKDMGSIQMNSSVAAPTASTVLSTAAVTSIGK
ncbi:ataxin-2 homolog [Drosophila persimilis]|uniref:ataxin-2 homolog n=1 Tax=Drosophila persimilis TaxID=7234 RepID=UPI000F077669|nr:ataxin-2 homolog [Drosophila persimilis]